MEGSKKLELSQREREVAALYALHGLQNKEMADRMCLSVKTIEQYWQRIAVKTGMSSIPAVRRHLLVERGRLEGK